MATRRAELAEGATDYAVEHGLIGLSLRPLAVALGTSDRMLLYHFRGKDDLVATILRTSAQRSVASIRALPPSRDLRSAVLDLWRASSTGPLQACQRLYVEAASLAMTELARRIGVGCCAISRARRRRMRREPQSRPERSVCSRSRYSPVFGGVSMPVQRAELAVVPGIGVSGFGADAKSIVGSTRCKTGEPENVGAALA